MTKIAGLILAGGRSSRMGRDKSFVPLLGQRLIDHVLQRLSPQVEALAISANDEAYEALHLPVLPDVRADRPGPLAGLAAGLGWARSIGAELLVTAPCDAPFLSADLVARLVPGPSVAQSPEGLEPLFACWPVSALEAVEGALEKGDLAVHRLLQALGARVVAIPAGEPPWWLNLNAEAELRAVEARLSSRQG